MSPGMIMNKKEKEEQQSTTIFQKLTSVGIDRSDVTHFASIQDPSQMSILAWESVNVAEQKRSANNAEVMYLKALAKGEREVDRENNADVLAKVEAEQQQKQIQ